MYEKLTDCFKKELIDRKIDILILSSFAVLFCVYLMCVIILWAIYKNWAILLISNFILFALCFVTAYTIVFSILKRKKQFCAKDYFNFRVVFNSLKDLFKKDTQILLPLIKSMGINTNTKVQEAISHYQFLLLRKSKNGFTVISILSLTVSICGIIFSAVKYQTNTELFLFIALLLSLLLCVTLICIAIKQVYRAICYNLSEYALYERIENGLTEILIKELL